MKLSKKQYKPFKLAIKEFKVSFSQGVIYLPLNRSLCGSSAKCITMSCWHRFLKSYSDQVNLAQPLYQQLEKLIVAFGNRGVVEVNQTGK